jgi:hypothetical protein
MRIMSFELALAREASNIERGLKEAVRKSAALEGLRCYLCLDGGLIHLGGSIWHIREPRKDMQSERIVLIIDSPCCIVLAVQRRQEVISRSQIAVHQVQSAKEEVQTNLTIVDRQEAKIYKKCME